MSILQGIRGHFSLFGPYGIFALAKARLLRRPLEIKVEVAGISHPIHLRLRTSDVSLFDEIIVNAEYAWRSFPSPRVIVDAGANVGLTSVFYANAYRGAKIIAVEPEPSNFALLKKNVAPYPNIVAVQAALWNENTMLSIYDPGRGSGVFKYGMNENPTMIMFRV